MNKYDETVFIVHVDDKEIEETSIRDFCGVSFIEETTTPRGIGPVYHVRGKELWTWGKGAPRKVAAYDSEAEAQEALEDTFAYDFWECEHIIAFIDRESAEKCLAEMLDEL